MVRTNIIYCNLYFIFQINMPNCEFLPQSQDCLMRNFLMIDFLETKLISLLLDKLEELSGASNPTDQNMCTCILILSQLSFVNRIANGDLIFDRISEIIRSSGNGYRNEIIKRLPDILDAKRHDAIVEKLM